MKRLFYTFLIIFSVLYSCNNEQEEDLNSKHLDHIARIIQQDLASVKEDIVVLANNMQYKIPYDKEAIHFSTTTYQYNPGQILSSIYGKTKSAVYYPAQKDINEHLKKIIVNTETLDSFFINTVQKNPFLSQVHFIDTNSFLRIYPYIDVDNYLKSSIDLRTLANYQLVNNKPFKQDYAYWINKPYADPYGRGWVISCVEPIYYRERFIGILSGDVTLHSLKEKYLSSGTEAILLTNKLGEVICCTKEAAKIINIPAIRDFQYYKPVTKTIYLFNSPSLVDHKNNHVKKAVQSLLSGSKKEAFYIDNKKYIIYKSAIEETGWLLFKIIN